MTEIQRAIPARIAVVDDSRSITLYLSNLLTSKGYIVLEFTDSEEALIKITHDAPDLVLLDIHMPKLNGYELCSRLKSMPAFKQIPIIFVSTEHDKDIKVKGFSLGAQDYITKPFEKEELLARVETHLHLADLQKEQAAISNRLARLVAGQVDEISYAQLGTIKALAKLAEYRDEDTGAHLFRVAEYCRTLGNWLLENKQYSVTREFIHTVAEASALHDIGKVAIPDAVLLKPGKLTPEEFEIMKTHSAMGAKTLKSVNATHTHNRYLSLGTDIALSHHEKWNGEGYPLKLSGKKIPLCGRIVAVADVYDALRSKRVYKPEFPHQKAYDIIVKDSGTHFDPVLVDAFKDSAAAFDKIWEKFKEEP
ncbi:MAG: response regulator [Deltaproteobacteria bacterium]|nr:response regulator [Deltaproteobacteria bacterium]